MKTFLNIKERIILLLQIIPKEGSFTDICVIRDLQNKLSVSDKERTDFEIRELPNGFIKWNEKKETDKEFNFGENSIRIIYDSLKEMDKKQKLTVNHVCLYKKFILMEND